MGSRLWRYQERSVNCFLFLLVIVPHIYGDDLFWTALLAYSGNGPCSAELFSGMWISGYWCALQQSDGLY